jgi:hypothetical protein
MSYCFRRYWRPFLVTLLVGALTVLLVSSVAAHAAVSTSKLGLYQSSNNASYTLAGKTPAYAIEYYGWQEAFKAPANSSSEEFAELQSNPGGDQSGVSLADITAGKYDSYLKSYAAEVKAYGKPILITFDHEMNGNWYPWGYQAVTPKQWIAAWDHVRAIIHAGAPNATFVWVPNVNVSSKYPMQDYYPGATETGDVGIDGYYESKGATWSSSGLAAAYAELHKLAPRKSFIVAETGVLNQAGAEPQLKNLVTNAAADHALAVFYFDSGKWALSTGRASYLASLLQTIPATTPTPTPTPTSSPTPTPTSSPTPTPTSTQNSGFVTASGSSLYLNGTKTQFIGFDAPGMLGPCWSGTTWTTAQMDAYFAGLPANGITRVFAVEPGGTAFVQEVVTEAAKYGQHVVLVLGDDDSYCDDTNGAPGGQGTGKTVSYYESGWEGQYLSWINTVVPMFADNPTVAMWEIANEPFHIVSGGTLTLTQEESYMNGAAAAIRADDPNHLIESGLADSADAGGTSEYDAVQSGPNIDVVSFHDYAWDYEGGAVTSSMAPIAQATGKPVFVGEAGVEGGTSCTASTGLSLNDRVSYLTEKWADYEADGFAGIDFWDYEVGSSSSCAYEFYPGDPMISAVEGL